jgi:hypothetical protein
LSPHRISPEHQSALGEPIEIARNLVTPSSLVLEGSDLYWIEFGHILTGVDDAFRDGRVLTMPKTGGEIRELARGQRRAISLNVAGDQVYWLARVDTFSTHELRVAPRRGGGTRGLLSLETTLDESSNQLMIAQNKLFVFANGLVSASLQRPVAMRLSSQRLEYCRGMASVGRRLYFIARSGYGNNQGTIFRLTF